MWRYTLQCGLYEIKILVKSIAKKIGVNEDVLDERLQEGKSRLFDLSFDVDGYLTPDVNNRHEHFLYCLPHCVTPLLASFHCDSSVVSLFGANQDFTDAITLILSPKFLSPNYPWHG